MNKLTYNQIISLQKGYKVTETQNQINSGVCWLLEGSVGRFASDMLEIGICMLPKTSHWDYYGNYVPSRDELKKGTKGTFGNAQNFWQKVYDGDLETINALEETFGRDEENEVA
jgi:hypothetical protein